KRFPGVFLGLLYRALERHSAGKQGGNRGGERAAGAVMVSRQPLPAVFARVVKNVYDVFSAFVRAGHEHELASMPGECPRAFRERGTWRRTGQATRFQ